MGVVVIRLPAASSSQGNLLPDLTPLLDVIFIVLVFFLLTAQTPLLELPLQLPQSREALPTASAGSGERMQIQLSAEGNWRFNGTPQTDFSALRTEMTAAFVADSAARSGPGAGSSGTAVGISRSDGLAATAGHSGQSHSSRGQS